MYTHTSPDPVDMLQAIIYAQGLFHLNAWKIKKIIYCLFGGKENILFIISDVSLPVAPA